MDAYQSDEVSNTKNSVYFTLSTKLNDPQTQL